MLVASINWHQEPHFSTIVMMNERFGGNTLILSKNYEEVAQSFQSWAVNAGVALKANVIDKAIIFSFDTENYVFAEEDLLFDMSYHIIWRLL